MDALAGGAARTVEINGKAVCDAAERGQIAASGWTAPIPGGVGSGFRTASRPSHNGVDIGAAKGTEIRAAATGRVLVSTLRPGPPRPAGAATSTDSRARAAAAGSSTCCTPVATSPGTATWWSSPFVNEDQLVTAGEVIGKVGSSGNSSGPHLHFEVHLRNDRNAVRARSNPVPFMRERGAPLRAAE